MAYNPFDDDVLYLTVMRERDPKWGHDEAGGCATGELCELMIRIYDKSQKMLADEIAVQQKIVNAKVKGQIRIAQRKIKELRQQISSIQSRKNCWFNGGVS